MEHQPTLSIKSEPTEEQEVCNVRHDSNKDLTTMHQHIGDGQNKLIVMRQLMRQQQKTHVVSIEEEEDGDSTNNCVRRAKNKKNDKKKEQQQKDRNIPDFIIKLEHVGDDDTVSALTLSKNSENCASGVPPYANQQQTKTSHPKLHKKQQKKGTSVFNTGEIHDSSSIDAVQEKDGCEVQIKTKSVLKEQRQIMNHSNLLAKFNPEVRLQRLDQDLVSALMVPGSQCCVGGIEEGTVEPVRASFASQWQSHSQRDASDFFITDMKSEPVVFFEQDFGQQPGTGTTARGETANPPQKRQYEEDSGVGDDSSDGVGVMTSKKRRMEELKLLRVDSPTADADDVSHKPLLCPKGIDVPTFSGYTSKTPAPKIIKTLPPRWINLIGTCRRIQQRQQQPPPRKAVSPPKRPPQPPKVTLKSHGPPSHGSSTSSSSSPPPQPPTSTTRHTVQGVPLSVRESDSECEVEILSAAISSSPKDVLVLVDGELFPHKTKPKPSREATLELEMTEVSKHVEGDIFKPIHPPLEISEEPIETPEETIKILQEASLKPQEEVLNIGEKTPSLPRPADTENNNSSRNAAASAANLKISHAPLLELEKQQQSQRSDLTAGCPASNTDRRGSSQSLRLVYPQCPCLFPSWFEQEETSVWRSVMVKNRLMISAMKNLGLFRFMDRNLFSFWDGGQPYLFIPELVFRGLLDLSPEEKNFVQQLLRAPLLSAETRPLTLNEIDYLDQYLEWSSVRQKANKWLCQMVTVWGVHLLYQALHYHHRCSSGQGGHDHDDNDHSPWSVPARSLFYTMRLGHHCRWSLQVTPPLDRKVADSVRSPMVERSLTVTLNDVGMVGREVLMVPLTDGGAGTSIEHHQLSPSLQMALRYCLKQFHLTDLAEPFCDCDLDVRESMTYRHLSMHGVTYPHVTHASFMGDPRPLHCWKRPEGLYLSLAELTHRCLLPPLDNHHLRSLLSEASLGSDLLTLLEPERPFLSTLEMGLSWRMDVPGRNRGDPVVMMSWSGGGMKGLVRFLKEQQEKEEKEAERERLSSDGSPESRDNLLVSLVYLKKIYQKLVLSGCHEFAPHAQAKFYVKLWPHLCPREDSATLCRYTFQSTATAPAPLRQQQQEKQQQEAESFTRTPVKEEPMVDSFQSDSTAHLQKEREQEEAESLARHPAKEEPLTDSFQGAATSPWQQQKGEQEGSESLMLYPVKEESLMDTLQSTSTHPLQQQSSLQQEESESLMIHPVKEKPLLDTFQSTSSNPLRQQSNTAASLQQQQQDRQEEHTEQLTVATLVVKENTINTNTDSLKKSVIKTEKKGEEDGSLLSGVADSLQQCPYSYEQQSHDNEQCGGDVGMDDLRQCTCPFDQTLHHSGDGGGGDSSGYYSGGGNGGMAVASVEDTDEGAGVRNRPETGRHCEINTEIINDNFHGQQNVTLTDMPHTTTTASTREFYSATTNSTFLMIPGCDNNRRLQPPPNTLSIEEQQQQREKSVSMRSGCDDVVVQQQSPVLRSSSSGQCENENDGVDLSCVKQEPIEEEKVPRMVSSHFEELFIPHHMGVTCVKQEPSEEEEKEEDSALHVGLSSYLEEPSVPAHSHTLDDSSLLSSRNTKSKSKTEKKKAEEAAVESRSIQTQCTDDDNTNECNDDDDDENDSRLLFRTDQFPKFCGCTVDHEGAESEVFGKVPAIQSFWNMRVGGVVRLEHVGQAVLLVGKKKKKVVVWTFAHRRTLYFSVSQIQRLGIIPPGTCSMNLLAHTPTSLHHCGFRETSPSEAAFLTFNLFPPGDHNAMERVMERALLELISVELLCFLSYNMQLVTVEQPLKRSSIQVLRPGHICAESAEVLFQSEGRRGLERALEAWSKSHFLLSLLWEVENRRLAFLRVTGVMPQGMFDKHQLCLGKQIFRKWGGSTPPLTPADDCAVFVRKIKAGELDELYRNAPLLTSSQEPSHSQSQQPKGVEVYIASINSVGTSSIIKQKTVPTAADHRQHTTAQQLATKETPTHGSAKASTSTTTTTTTTSVFEGALLAMALKEKNLCLKTGMGMRELTLDTIHQWLGNRFMTHSVVLTGTLHVDIERPFNRPILLTCIRLDSGKLFVNWGELVSLLMDQQNLFQLAQKLGMSFHKLPPALTLHLKRHGEDRAQHLLRAPWMSISNLCALSCLVKLQRDAAHDDDDDPADAAPVPPRIRMSMTQGLEVLIRMFQRIDCWNLQLLNFVLLPKGSWSLGD